MTSWITRIAGALINERLSPATFTPPYFVKMLWGINGGVEQECYASWSFR